MRILIVEDEATAAQRLERLATAHLGTRLKEIVHAETVERGRRALAASRFDLVLLDLDLNGADGFDIIRGSGDTPRVVVVSARTDRAIDAFDNAVIDFVAKPVTQERLARALDRAMEAASPAGAAGPSLVVRSAGRIQLAPLTDVMLLSGAGDYVEVTLADGRKLLHDVRLDDLEKRLPASWLRVHRSHIVNLKHVRGTRKVAGGRHVVELRNGAEIPVSRRRAPQVVAALTS
ncbi:MAG: LytTR family DNA-binding domain-containing protein [Hyphomonadaceae bacterium]|nr:LytTR family DNA-binding domain-containing protein [Hyphomonadaceae bacterium]